METLMPERKGTDFQINHCSSLLLVLVPLLTPTSTTFLPSLCSVPVDWSLWPCGAQTLLSIQQEALLLNAVFLYQQQKQWTLITVFLAEVFTPIL